MEAWLGKSIIPFDELLWQFGLVSAAGLLLGLDSHAPLIFRVTLSRGGH